MTLVHEDRSALLESLRKDIRRQTCVVVKFREVCTRAGEPIIIIEYIIVPDKKRRTGRGRRAMEMICAAADVHHWELELQVDSYWGTPEPVLRAFYYGFGFRTVPAPGRRICMVREPMLNAGSQLLPVTKTSLQISV